MSDAHSRGPTRRDLIRFPVLAAAQAALGLPALGLRALALPGLALTSCAPGQPPEPVSPVAASATGIDVHCHVFNAHDLPIPGFVVHVVLEADPLAPLQVGPLVAFIALLIDAGTPTSDAEIADLRNGTEPKFLLAAASPGRASLHDKAFRAAMGLQAPDARQRDVIDRVARILRRNQGFAAHAAFAAADLHGPEQTTALLQSLASLTPDGKLSAPGPAVAHSLAPRAPAATPEPGALAEAAAKGVERNAANGSGVFYLADLITDPRNTLVRRLENLPQAADRGSIALYTPALIDFSYWLDDNADNAGDPSPADDPGGVTPLSGQVAVMSAIAAIGTGTDVAKRSYAVHPFVSFCPWRQIAEARRLPPGMTQFDTVKDAILNKGFIGVKLYPVMGFRPTGNAAVASATPAIYPGRLRALGADWAARMDAALADLYQFCTDQDVPIMAHCSFSQYPSREAGLLGGPAGWWEVLARWPSLRLNLAHCGGVWNLAPDRAAAIEAKTGQPLWPIDIIARLGRPEYPHLYADLADFDGVLTCPTPPPAVPQGCRHSADGEPLLARLAEEVGCNPAARERLMYGTDYMFLIQAAHTEKYLDRMRNCLAPALGMAPEDLMGLNAARFLGLNDRGSGARRRLDRFRGDRFLDRWTVPA